MADRTTARQRPSKARNERLEARISRRAIQLNAADSRVFAEALLDPRKPSARLKAAARRYMETLGGTVGRY